jgi:hypothetical protein
MIMISTNRNKCNVENVPHESMVVLFSTYNLQAYKLHKRVTMINFIKCKKVKCAIKFVRSLLINFLITKNLIWKIDKSMMNILGIAIMLIGRYGRHIGKLWSWELYARVELILDTNEG